MNLELLQKFCSTDDSRYGIIRPFSHGEHTYATDGRIMIRIPKMEDFDERPGQPSNPGQAIPRAGLPAVLVELPPGWHNFPINQEDCSRCQTTGKCRKCPDCDGEGEGECPHCGNEAECGRCKGTGVLGTGDGETCQGCDGAGKLDKETPVMGNRGRVALNLKYLKLAHELPGLKILMPEGSEPYKDALRLEFEGGEGAIMAMRAIRSDFDALTVAQWPDMAAAGEPATPEPQAA